MAKWEYLNTTILSFNDDAATHHMNEQVAVGWMLITAQVDADGSEWMTFIWRRRARPYPQWPLQLRKWGGVQSRRHHPRHRPVSFNYTKGSSHSQNSALGIGVSGTGFNAGYTTDGSHMSTASSAEGYAAEHRNTWFRTEFNTGQYRGVCTGLPGTNVHPVKQKNCPKTFGPFNAPVHKCIWMIHSTGWSGGQTTQHPKSAPPTPRSDCRKHEAGDRYDGDHGSAIEWSQGFELGAALNIKGIDGKASFNSTTHTGYDTNAVMLYRFHHTGYLCGTNGTEATAAIIVQRANLP